MKKISIAITCFLGAVCSTAFAENKAAKEERSGYYVDAAYTLVAIEDTSSSNLGTWKPTMGRITFGKEISENWAVEGFITQGINSDTLTISGVDFKVKGNTSYGVAIRPFLKATNDLEIYGRVGWIQNKFTLSADALSTSEDYTWNQYLWSLGVAYKISDNFSAIIDYTKFTKKEDANTTSTAVGVRYNF